MPENLTLHTASGLQAPAPSASPSAPAAFRSVKLLGTPVADLSLEATIGKIQEIVATGRPHQHCVINAGKVVLMYRDPVLKRIVENCALINADGQSVVWALKLLGRPIPERVTGIDLMERLFEVAEQRGYRLYFLGARQEVLDVVLSRVKARFPNVRIAGASNGYFSEAENDAVVADIAASNADILFVAMGSPKKEYWLARNLENLKVPFCMGVGGSFDVYAGYARRAPRWIQKIGMEWFFRFIQEPRRLWRRYVFDNFVFIYLILMARLGREHRLSKVATTDLVGKEIT